MISQSLLVQRNPTFPLLTLQALRHSIVGAGGKVSEAVRRNVLETLLDIINSPSGDSADAASSTTRMAAAGAHSGLDLSQESRRSLTRSLPSSWKSVTFDVQESGCSKRKWCERTLQRQIVNAGYMRMEVSKFVSYLWLED